MRVGVCRRGLALCVTALVSGCATPVARNVQTASGKPEVTIARTDVSAVKSHFLNLSINDGYSLEKDSEFTLELSRSLEGMENLAATMVAGNGYSGYYLGIKIQPAKQFSAYLSTNIKSQKKPAVEFGGALFILTMI